MLVTDILSFAHEDEDTQNLIESISLSPAERLERGIALCVRLKNMNPSKYMRIVDDFILNLIRVFDSTKLRYLVVGGYAVNIHGYIRASDDFDIWLDNTTANLSNFRHTLLNLGIEKNKVYELVNTLAKPNDATVYRFKIDGNNVDFLMQLSGIPDFEKAYQQKIVVKLSDLQIPFISLEDLIRAKASTDRTKDKLDLEMLLLIREQAKENL